MFTAFLHFFNCLHLEGIFYFLNEKKKKKEKDELKAKKNSLFSEAKLIICYISKFRMNQALNKTAVVFQAEKCIIAHLLYNVYIHFILNLIDSFKCFIFGIYFT